MPLDDVPPEEMLRSSAAPDPIDAALRGGPVGDPAIEALVTDIRAAYLRDEPRPRSSALAAFAGPVDGSPAPIGAATAATTTATTATTAPTRARPARSRLVIGLAAFAATITGKVVSRTTRSGHFRSE